MEQRKEDSGSEILESSLLVVILLLVGGFAGAASFTHVKDWTLANSPGGTEEWFGWGNAVISELVPIACALVIRRRRRAGQPYGYPLAILIAAACLSLAAQLAVAKAGPSGWLLSAVPALAFMALVKLVLSTPTPRDVARHEEPAAAAPTQPAPELARPARAAWPDRGGRATLPIVARHRATPTETAPPPAPAAPRAIPSIVIPAPLARATGTAPSAPVARHPRHDDGAPPRHPAPPVTAPPRHNGAPVARAIAVLARPATEPAPRATRATPARATESVADRRRRIAEYRRANPDAGSRVIAKALNIPDRTVSRDLDALKEES